ncbi:S8 family peptidase [Segatella bryantii]|uniref:S8 family peptidase n=1 Tax=Segatella bryantii TaxID=77095 RepID=UPI002478C5C0|nr:S8 family peptidase [Segatella bryantii]
MRKLLSSLFVFISLLANGQSGYYYDNDFVTLTPISSGPNYVIAHSQLLAPALAQQNQGSSSNNNFQVKAIANHEYIVQGINVFPQDSDYVSKTYATSSGDTLFVAPQIVCGLNEGYSLDDVLNQFPVLTLEDVDLFGDEFVFTLDCNVTTSTSVLGYIHQLNLCSAVRWCEPVKYINIKKENAFYDTQYYLKNTINPDYDINVEPAWQICIVDTTLIVAVVDQGLDRNHEDLGNVTLNGYTVGYSNAGEPINYDNNDGGRKAHGMMCAGIIGANDNYIGIKGIAPGIKLMPVNIFPKPVVYDVNNPNRVLYSGAASDKYIAKAIIWAVNNGADIINCSWGSQGKYKYINYAIRYALDYGRDGKGCIIVAAAGNDYNESSAPLDVTFPAYYDEVIAVGAIDSSGKIAGFSQRGNHLDLVAPGVSIISTDRMSPLGYSSFSNYAILSGTSFSAPQVAGVAALMLSINPSLTGAQVRNILKTTAKDLGTAGRDNTFGYGLVDAYEAVKASYRGTMSIDGPTTICDSASYYVEHLPNGATVDWAYPYYNCQLNTNSIIPNGCTVVNTLKESTDRLLFATIKVNGNIIASLNKRIITEPEYIQGTYSQSSCEFHNVLHPAISTSTITATSAPAFVHQGCEVTVQSNSFVGKTITTSGLTPDFFAHNDKYVYFRLPYGSGGIPFYISVNGEEGCSDGRLLFFAIGANQNAQNSIKISNDSGNTTFTLTKEENLTIERGIFMNELASQNLIEEEIHEDWTIEIYSTANPRKVFASKVAGNQFVLDTSTYQPGIYIVNVRVGEETISDKFTIK